ncbi:MAG: hypothetical protein OEQ81_09390 [Flavobacteriaceae bacterium]|nr:hypothetical protein [Flavobacteriaceae bacterium]
MNQIFLIVGGATSLLWGVSHLFPTKNVVNGFGDISVDNKYIITMEWIIEGVSLIFLGILTIFLAVTDSRNEISIIVFWFVIAMLIVLAIISLFTGFRVNFLPYKLCPFIFLFSALCVFLGIMI